MRSFVKGLLFSIIVIVLLNSVVADSDDLKRVIVLYKNKIGDKHMDELKIFNAKIRHRHRIIPAISTEMAQKDIDKLRLDRDVVGVYEDMRVHTFLDDSVSQINADQAHFTTNGAGVKVCIVDTGVDDSHNDLDPLVAEHDFVNNDGDATDDNGHGTHVAGIVASKDSTFKGVAFGASLMAAKSLDSAGSGFSSDVIAGIDWCVSNGADIISMSLGGGSFSSTCDSDPIAISSNNAVDQGVVVLAASGNDGSLTSLASPACGSKVLAIGAVDKNDARTSYSNEGTELDVVAPGSSITSTYLGDTTASLSGTSMATPHAAGTAALVLENSPGLSPQEVGDILKSTALDLGAIGFDTIYGYGRIDALAAIQAEPPTTNEIFSDNFNDGALDNSKWTLGNALENNKCGFQSSSRALHFTGTGSRYAATKALDVSSGGEISFYLKFGTLSGSSSGCENADNREDVVLEYSTDGNTWTIINTYDTEVYTSFTLIKQAIPDDAKTSSTFFRWRQVRNSGSNWDNWAIDDVSIEVISDGCTEDSECSDGLYCNGEEICDAGVCQLGTVIDCSGLDDQCNLGICDEDSDSCVQEAAFEGVSCDDGLYCNNGETCQSGICTGGFALDCSDGNQCTQDSCNEDTDSCENIAVIDGTSCDNGQFCSTNNVCNSGVCEGIPRDCSDSVACTIDSCDENNDTCVNIPDNSFCGDGLFCNGVEICDSLLGCQSGIPPLVDDSVSCTIDSCDEDTDSILHIPDNSLCDNNLYCDGAEICDLVLDCQSGIPVQCDNGLFCDGVDTCNEATDSCDPGVVVDCSDGVSCTIDSCNEATDSCDNIADNSVCDNGLFCDGAEICHTTLGCQSGSTVDCNDNDECTTESCNEGIDACEYSEVPECAEEVKCWSGSNNYLRRSNSQSRKFCKCAEGTYSFQQYSRLRSRSTAYRYASSGDNENWETLSSTTTRLINSVKCADGNWYNTNEDYYT